MFCSPLGFVPGTCQSQWETAPLLFKEKTSKPVLPSASRSLQFTPDDREPSQKQ